MRRPFSLMAASQKLISVLVVTAFLVGCAVDPFPQKVVERLDEAGSTHIAVLSVTDFEAYKDKLQPFFEMTAKEALDLAIPSTILTEEKLLSATTARLALAPERISTTGTETLKREHGKTSVQTEEITREVQPGEVPETPKSPFGEKTAATLPPSGDASASKGELEVDPILQHLVATAIYQEVQMLNTYIDDAATGADCIAYIVRLQVGLMPAARNMPYDAYVAMSFFYVKGETSCGVPGPPPGPAPMAVMAPPRRDRDENDECKKRVGNPKIIPLLVTDSLEGALSSRSVERIREFALALPFMFQGFGGAAEISHLVDNLQAAVSRDLNSVFSVARLSDNTLRIRLGAMRSGPHQYAMVPRTHNVTVLLLVNKEAFIKEKDRLGMQIFAKTTFVNADSGKPLPPRSHAEGRKVARSLLRNYAPWIDKVKDTVLDELLGYTQLNDYQKFSTTLDRYRPNDKSDDDHFRYAGALWVDLLSARVGSQFAYASFELDKPPDAPVALQHQTPLLLDNGKDTTTAALYGGKNLNGDNLTAKLWVRKKESKTYELPAREIQILDGGRLVWLTFPSLSYWGLDKLTKEPAKLAIIDTKCGNALLDTNFIYQKKPTPIGPPLEIIWRGGQIIASKSRQPEKGRVGMLQIELKKTSGDLRLKVSGADVQKAESEPESFLSTTNVNELPLNDEEGSAKVTLQLCNLDQSNGVGLIGVDADERIVAGPIWIPVVNRQDDR